MSNKLLIYIGEDEKFDADATIQAIESIPGVSKARRGTFIGAIFECDFEADGRSTIVRLSPDLETITADGLGAESLRFALELQHRTRVNLRAIDMGYNFDVSLRDFQTVSELLQAISAREAASAALLPRVGLR